MIIDCISDLHGFFPKLSGGDLLIIAGDLTQRDTTNDYIEFLEWLNSLDYRKKIFIAGNHDRLIEKHGMPPCMPPSVDPRVTYLQDSGTEFDGLKIWGSPWSLTFDGINPKCKAFTVDTDKELKKKWDLIRDDIDILVTHIPPNGILDSIQERNCHLDCDDTLWYSNVGSISLRNMVISNKFPNLKLHIFGHIHEWGGRILDTVKTKFINASYVDETYDPIHKPIRVVI